MELPFLPLTRTRPRRAFALAVTVSSLLTASLVASDPTPTLTYDLRLQGGGNAKERTVNVGDTITIAIYAVVSGTDGVNDEGFQSGYGSIFNSSTGTVVGDLKTSTLTNVMGGANFAGLGSSRGTFSQLDADATHLTGRGGADLGSTSTAQNSNYFNPRSSTMVTSGANPVAGTTEFLLGTVQYTVTAADTSSSTASLNFAVPTFSSIFARQALFKADGISRNELNATITVGTAVNFTNGPDTTYWKGGQGAGGLASSWTTDLGTTSAQTNFTTDATGATIVGTLPGIATTVHFSDSTGATSFDTDLGTKDQSIKGLVIDTSSSVTIASANNRVLAVGASGIEVNSGGTHTISAGVALGADQSWSVSAGNTLSVSGIVSGAANLTKTGSGTVTLSGANTYTGSTTVDGGTLEIDGASSISSTSGVKVNTTGTLLLSAGAGVSTGKTITLDGGTLAVGSAAAHSIGNLTLSSNSTLDLGLGVGDSAITFLDATDWAEGSILTIQNWDGHYGAQIASGDHIYFSGGLTETQLASIRFDRGGGNYFEAFLVGDEFVAVPEPGAVGAALLLLGAVGWRERRRLGAVRSLLKPNPTL